MKKLKQLFKFLAVTILMLSFIVYTCLARLIIRNELRRRKFYIHTVHEYAKLALRLMGVKIHLGGEWPIKNHLMVANHLSYLDALLLASVQPACFVTSVEMRNTPFLGLLTELGGCLFVERRSRENLNKEISAITWALCDGLNVIIFPEATSTNGEKVLPFKRSLLQAAIDADTPLLPVCINYAKIDGNPVTSANRDTLCWYGDMGFAGHFFGIMAPAAIEISITALTPIAVTSDSTREELSEKAYAQVAAAYKNIH
jgi:lyso-ornithine lipid O-acyltransferase